MLGSGLDCAWPRRVQDWLLQAFPGKDIHVTNRAVPGEWVAAQKAPGAAAAATGITALVFRQPCP